LTFANAKSYCSQLAGGFRVPSSNELQTLVDFTKPSPGPTIDLTAFPDALSVQYWTASVGMSSGAALSTMAVLFKDGSTTPAVAVRCVHN
jgi:hypothetical protein